MLDKYILKSKVLKVDSEKKTVTLEIEFDMDRLAKDFVEQMQLELARLRSLLIRHSVEEFAEVFRSRLGTNVKEIKSE